MATEYRMSSGMSLTKAVTDLEEIFRKLSAKGEILSDLMKCSFLLSALPSEYTNIKGAIYASGQNLVWTELIHKLHSGKSADRKLSKPSHRQTEEAFMAPSVKPRRTNKEFKPRRGGFKSSHTTKTSTSTTTISCYCCKGNHLVKDCTVKCTKCARPIPLHRKGECPQPTSRALKASNKSGPSDSKNVGSGPAWFSVQNCNTGGSQSETPMEVKMVATAAKRAPIKERSSVTFSCLKVSPRTSLTPLLSGRNVQTVVDSGCATHHLAFRTSWKLGPARAASSRQQAIPLW